VKNWIVSAGVGIVLLTSSGLVMAAQGDGAGAGAGLHQQAMTLLYEALSAEEEEGLLLMREEEKLARDVYRNLFSMWGEQIFNAISQSEQRHMDAVGMLLEKYGVPDPVVDDIGVFSTPELAALYDELLSRGSVSLSDALWVGATIEDLDIYDLQAILADPQVDNIDIRTVYQNLLKGSRNHLRAFAYHLSLLNISYVAQYLSQEEIDAIIDAPWERGRYDENGEPISGGYGRRGSK